MIFTAQDVVDHLLTAVGGGAQDGEHRAIRQAVIHGVREVVNARNWLWHTKTNFFLTQQTSTTATVTSGSNQIVVASNSGMVVGRLLETPASYFPRPTRITAINGTTITLDNAAVTQNPVVNYTNVPVLVQTYYDLPEDMKDIDALVTNTVGTLHCYITPQEWQRLEINTRGAGEPYYYTIMRSDAKPDRYQIRFVGVPTNATPVYYTYRYTPRMVKYMGYEPICRQGTVTPSGSAPQSVTGSGTAFQSDMEGCIFRVGTVTTEADPVGALRSFVGESKITAVANTSSLTLEGAVPTTAGVKYAISDIIDCSPQMYTAILSAAELWYARLAGKPGDDIVALFNRDLRLAMERDVVSPLAGQPYLLNYKTPRTMGYYSSQGADQGSSKP